MRPVFDDHWRRRALDADRDALELLTAEMLKPLYRFCFYRVGRNQHVCEEVVQETLLRAIGELEKYDPVRSGGDIFGWLTGLARNEIRRALAFSKSAVSLEQLWERMDRELLSLFARLDSQPLADELLCRAETREMVNATMSQLPARYRDALEAKYVLGRSVADIAAACRMTEKAAESQLTRARAAFRATFGALARNLTAEVSK